MKKSRFNEAQIIAVLKEYDAGKKVADLAREHGISEATFYTWKSKTGSNPPERELHVGQMTQMLLPKYAPLEKLGASYFVEGPSGMATDIGP